MLEGNNHLLGKYEQLLPLANRALESAPLSVTQKSFVPSSGDKRDYVSMGPYWWPNPSSGGNGFLMSARMARLTRRVDITMRRSWKSSFGEFVSCLSPIISLATIGTLNALLI